MLKNDHGARAVGMGAAWVSVSGDPNATLYNPAHASAFEKFTASFGHTVFWERIRAESGYIASRLSSRLSAHGGIRFAVIDDLEARRFPTSEPVALFDAHDVSFKAGLAYKVTGNVSAGFALGWFVEKIEAWRGSAFNADFGVLVSPMTDLNLAASATNIGSDFYLEKEGLRGSRAISLPTTYRLGGSYRWRSSYLGALDIVIVDEEFHLHSGVEARIRELLALRTGYMFNYDTKNFTAGASFTKRGLTVDYAFVPFTENLGTSHLFNITFTL
ncbi:MAG TPA: PorV/PorQ family protein [Candidatus Deferrimicrobium sp.]|nr:PorV/PorQ family protein [Candidatus Deferrimicrobium sp.]